MRDAAFVKACELVVEFRKQASHWKKLLFATSDELSAARHALSDLAKACEDLQKDQDCSFNNAVSDSIRKILGAVEGEFTIHAAERCVKVKDSLRDERDDLRKIVEMVHADLGIQPGDHIGEAINKLKKEASDATARQRMTEARALNYSLQADEARREIERLRVEAFDPDAVRALQDERDALKRDVERLQGIKPELPPRDGRGEGLPRYGLRWNGPDQPVATPMDDGFWVPWHLAKAAEMERTEWKREVESLRAKLVDRRSSIGRGVSSQIGCLRTKKTKRNREN